MTASAIGLTGLLLASGGMPPDADRLFVTLTVNPYSSPEMTVYAVFDSGEVMRQQILKRTGKPLSSQVAYVTRPEVENLGRVIADGGLRDYDSSEFERRFPGRSGELAEGGSYSLDLASSPDGGSARKVWMPAPAYYARLDPSFLAATTLAELESRLRSLFQ